MITRAKSSKSAKAAQARLAVLLATAPPAVKAAYASWLAAVTALDDAPRASKYRLARVWARRLGVRPGSLWTKRSEWRARGNIALLDKRFSANCWSGRRALSPRRAIRRYSQSQSRIVRQVLLQFRDDGTLSWQKQKGPA